MPASKLVTLRSTSSAHRLTRPPRAPRRRHPQRINDLEDGRIMLSAEAACDLFRRIEEDLGEFVVVELAVGLTLQSWDVPLTDVLWKRSLFLADLLDELGGSDRAGISTFAEDPLELIDHPSFIGLAQGRLSNVRTFSPRSWRSQRKRRRRTVPRVEARKLDTGVIARTARHLTAQERPDLRPRI